MVPSPVVPRCFSLPWQPHPFWAPSTYEAPTRPSVVQPAGATMGHTLRDSGCERGQVPKIQYTKDVDGMRSHRRLLLRSMPPRWVPGGGGTDAALRHPFQVIVYYFREKGHCEIVSQRNTQTGLLSSEQSCTSTVARPPDRSEPADLVTRTALRRYQ